ncbi:RNase H domain-containing protein [Phthorimaea operculella]|nr:RNase H domain-containing protein [Phthorimaea operculella]
MLDTPTPTSNGTEWCDEFLNKLAPPYAPLPNEFPMVFSEFESFDPLSRPFTLSEINAVIPHLPDTAPGLDGVSYSFIRHAPNNAKQAPLFQSDKLPIYSTSFNAVIFEPDVVLSIGIDKNTIHANEKFLDIVNSRWPNGVHLFTDASKLDDDSCVGCAFICPAFDHISKHKLPPECSVFSGECIALISALTYTANRFIKDAIIFTDALSVLSSISHNPFKNCARNILICKIKELLYLCHTTDLNVKLIWIPSHVGITGNERPDSLAKDAIESGDSTFYQNFSHDMSALPVTSVLIRLRLGHVCSPSRRHKYHLRDSPTCDCGEDIGTPEHILFSCPLNNNCPPLYTLLAKCKDAALPMNLNYLLTIPSKKIFITMAKFISCNNIKL